MYIVYIWNVIFVIYLVIRAKLVLKTIQLLLNSNSVLYDCNNNKNEFNKLYNIIKTLLLGLRSSFLAQIKAHKQL